jgi:predicted CopG family antitoxin
MAQAEEDMGDTSIRVSDELADELFDRKQRGESYEDVIWRLIEEVDEGAEE